ncbi:MAG: hypothetical protein LBL44_12700 [Treponema sp.]|nr:hypothetical protein [Treponema sp.]
MVVSGMPAISDAVIQLIPDELSADDLPLQPQKTDAAASKATANKTVFFLNIAFFLPY